MSSKVVMGDHPNKSASFSVSRSGDVESEPQNVVSVVVTNQDDEACGVLEKWDSEAWMYADKDALMELN